MIARLALPTLAMLAGIALAAAYPPLPGILRQLAGASSPAAAKPDAHPHAHPHGGKEEAGQAHAEEGRIAMTDAQITAAGITVATAAPGTLRTGITVPGTLAANGDRLARVPARLSGTVLAVRKGLGEHVTAGDVLATIESRDLADAKADLLTTARALSLADSVHQREARLWRQRVSAHTDLLAAAAAADEARIKHGTARHRLAILGLTEHEVAAIPHETPAERRFLTLRAPIAGQVTARAAIPGAPVAADTELFSIADLSTLWVELAIPPRDLSTTRTGGTIRVLGTDGHTADARIAFLDPRLDAETRSARALAELPNPEGLWRPGAFVTANLVAEEREAGIVVPREAVQQVENETVVFLRTPEGFEKREVALGREGAGQVEIVFGLDAGQEVAVANAFALKAELGKSEAGHAH